jgi:peroxidase
MDMDFVYAPESVRLAIENGGAFPDTDERIRHLISIGDERAAMLPQLHAVVLAWIRFHNEIVEQLHAAHPSVSDEIIFFESRRLVIAVYQSVWLREVLPLILTDDAIRRHRLDERRTCFDESVDPVISAEFSSAVARFFHKFIRENYVFKASDGRRKVVRLNELFQSEINAYEEFEGLLAGLANSPYNTDEVAGFLFAGDHYPGIDLRALDIQAERDFGVAGYCEFLHELNLTDGKCISTFSDLKGFISEEVSQS